MLVRAGVFVLVLDWVWIGGSSGNISVSVWFVVLHKDQFLKFHQT